MTKPRLVKVRALLYVLQHIIQRGCAYFDTASFSFCLGANRTFRTPSLEQSGLSEGLFKPCRDARLFRLHLWHKIGLSVSGAMVIKNIAMNCCWTVIHSDWLAERQGFEPWVPKKVQRFSRPPRSTTPASLQRVSDSDCKINYFSEIYKIYSLLNFRLCFF